MKNKIITLILLLSCISTTYSQEIEQYTVLPVPSNRFKIGTNFGGDNNGIGDYLHYGIDIYIPDNTVIFASRAGVVEHIGYKNGTG